MKIARDLERKLQTRPIHPVIVEFESREAMQELLPKLKDMVNLRELTIPTAPRLDFVGRPLRRLQLLREAPVLRSAFQSIFVNFKQIPRFNMVSLPLGVEQIEEIAEVPRVLKIYPDRVQWIYQTVPPEAVRVTPRGKKWTSLLWAKRLIGADKANEEGWTGKGVTVSILDTGGTPVHPMTTRMEYHTVMKEKLNFKDKNGHGQWCVACVGGRKFFDPTFRVELEGMAVDSHLVGIKCLGFVIGMGSQSDVIEAIALSLKLGSHIVSMSLGSDEMPESPEDDAECRAVGELVREGVIPVIAAGNSGPDPETIGTPGCCPQALTVGAWDQFEEKVAGFSSRGPTLWGDIKPDIVAPGVNIYSACLGILDLLDKVENRFAWMSGTSMSTPAASGLIACAYQMFKEKYNVDLTVGLVKEIAERYGHSKDNESGYGFITWDWFKRYEEEELR